MEMMEVGLEDDVFFADLNKQISLLIMEDDDDDDDYNPVPVVNSPSVSLQNFPQYHPPQHPMIPSQILYQPPQQQPQPQQISSCRRETKGTGVFIPLLLSQPRRNRSKQGRNASSSYNHKSNYSKQIVSARVLSPRHHHHHRYHHHQEPAYTPTTTLNGSNQIRYY